MLIKNTHIHQYQPHHLHNNITIQQNDNSNNLDTDNNNLPLSKKIENEIFDKSIEDIEKIFNFKINTTLDDINESLSPSSTLTPTSSSSSAPPPAQLFSSLSSKKRKSDYIDDEDCRIYKRLNHTTNTSNNNIANTKAQPIILKSSRNRTLLQKARENSRRMVNSIYLQDFNTFRDDLLDELFELHETLKNLN